MLPLKQMQTSVDGHMENKGKREKNEEDKLCYLFNPKIVPDNSNDRLGQMHEHTIHKNNAKQ